MNDKKMKLLASNVSQLETESAFDVLKRAQNRAAAGHPVINLGIGQPDFETSAYIVEAAVKALRDGLHGYTAAAGTDALREGVAARLAPRSQDGAGSPAVAAVARASTRCPHPSP